VSRVRSSERLNQKIYSMRAIRSHSIRCRYLGDTFRRPLSRALSRVIRKENTHVSAARNVETLRRLPHPHRAFKRARARARRYLAASVATLHPSNAAR